jgi:hypothetical protein
MLNDSEMPTVTFTHSAPASGLLSSPQIIQQGYSYLRAFALAIPSTWNFLLDSAYVLFLL